ncbi:MAG: hypothetical protein ACRERV_17305 [Methylococcales bacterium]
MYYKIIIQASTETVGEYEKYSVGDGVRDPTELLSELFDAVADWIEIEEDADLPDAVEDIHGRIQGGDPDRIFAVLEDGEWRYRGIERL